MRGADCNTRQFVVESVEQRFGYLGRLGGSDNVDREAFDRKYTRRLNLQQTEAVHAVDGAVLLLAVPGSGKTTVLVTRLGYMLCCCGIAPDQLPHIFERFYKADRARSGGGTGLGLSICRHIVDAHGGKIWAESVENEGSDFYFSLPVVYGEN